MNKELELYLHIPFCIKKCNYCDFLSAAADDEVKERYVNALINEIRACRELYGDRKVNTIFIGGGTPSIIASGQMEKIVTALKETFDLSGLKGKSKTFFRKKAVPPSIEFTVECNPKTLDKEKLKVYKKIGINRLSIGLQSANDNELKELGRIHTVSDFLDTFEAARLAGFDNINVDMMQSIPLQNLESWKKGLMAVCTLRPEHISAYSLIIEEGTPFYDRMHSDMPLALPDEDTEREIYYSTKEILEQFGYKRYEISNYALPGRECRHNEGYWRRKDYLGIGLGSSSLIDDVRWKNISDLNTYIGMFEQEKPPENIWEDLRTEVESLSVKDRMAEFMFLGLRMTDGVTKEEFFEQFGTDYDYVYEEATVNLVRQGLLNVIENEYIDELTGEEKIKTVIKLTDKGVDVSNLVFSEFV